MNSCNRLLGALFLTGGSLASFSAWADPATNSAATSLPDAPVTQKAATPVIPPPHADWYANASLDYYNFKSTFHSTGAVSINNVPASGSGNKLGSLFGATLDLAPPGLYPDGKLLGVIELSGHAGDLKGGIAYTSPGGSFNTVLDTTWQEYTLNYKFYPQEFPLLYPGKTFWIFALGLQYDRWQTTETIQGGGIWTQTGSPVQHYVQQAGSIDLSLEYGIYFVNKTFENHDTLHWGVRGQGFGAFGESYQNGDAGPSRYNPIYNLGAKGTMFLDYSFALSSGHLFSVFAEGGWLYTYWDSINTTTELTTSDSIKGPYARAGVKFSF